MTKFMSSARGSRRAAVAVVATLSLAALAACDSSKDSSGGSSSEAGVSKSIKPDALLSSYKGELASYPTSYPSAKKQDIPCTIGWSSPTEAQGSLKLTGEAMAAEGKKLGCKIIVTDAALSVDKQVSDIKQLVAQKVNAIVYYPLDAQALAPALKQAAAAGIKNIAIEATEGDPTADVPGTVTQIQHGLDQVAYAHVKAVADVKPKGKVGIIGIGVPVPSLKYFATRQKYWAEKLGLTVVGQQDNATDDPTGGEKAASSLLAKTPGLDAIIAYNDSSAFGAYTAARSSGRKDLLIIGVNGDTDAIAAVKKGQETMTVKLNVVPMGQSAVIAAYDAMTGVDIPKLVVNPASPFTAANAPEYTSWKQDIAKIAGS